jgi:hypothetical protein
MGTELVVGGGAVGYSVNGFSVEFETGIIGGLRDGLRVAERFDGTGLGFRVNGISVRGEDVTQYTGT